MHCMFEHHFHYFNSTTWQLDGSEGGPLDLYKPQHENHLQLEWPRSMTYSSWVELASFPGRPGLISMGAERRTSPPPC